MVLLVFPDDSSESSDATAAYRGIVSLLKISENYSSFQKLTANFQKSTVTPSSECRRFRCRRSEIWMRIVSFEFIVICYVRSITLYENILKVGFRASRT